MNYAVKDFLRTRLHLETSEEKSKVINLKKNSSEFLGFSIKAKKKGKTRFGYVAKSSMTKKAKTNARTLQKRYKGYQAQLYKIQEMVFVPIHAQRCKTNLCFAQVTCNYTVEGRAKIYKNLKAVSKVIIRYVMKSFIPNRSIEYNDNRIGKFIAQYGKCAILETELGLSDWHCHHIEPYHLSKDDSFSNLMVLHEKVHRLIHLKDNEKIIASLKGLNLSKKAKRKGK